MNLNDVFLTTIIGGLAGWLGTVLTNRIYLKDQANHTRSLEQIRQENLITIETLRTTNAFQLSVLENTKNLLLASNSAIQEKRIKSIEELWIELRKMRQIADNALFVYSVKLPEEYGTQNDKLDHLYNENNVKEWINLKKHSTLDKIRIFLGERLWLTSYIYETYIGRRMVVLDEVYKKTKAFPHWEHNIDGKADNGFMSLLLHVISQEEFDSIKRNNRMGQPHQILNLIESKIIIQANEVLSNKVDIHANTEELLKVLAMTNEKFLEQKEFDKK